MSTLKELYEAAKERRIASSLYPLPDNEVCAFDVPVIPGIALHVSKDYRTKGCLTLGLIVDNAHVHDLRLTISGGHTKGSVLGFLDILAALRAPQLTPTPDEVQED